MTNRDVSLTKNLVDLRDFKSRALAQHQTMTGRMPSQKEVQLWLQLAECCNSHISTGNNEPNKFKVLPFPTGIGKTTKMAVYLEMLAEQNTAHPERTTKCLFVTRTIQQVDEMVEQINAIADRQVAVARHSNSMRKLSTSELAGYDILVVTHQGYNNALLPHETHLTHSDMHWSNMFADLVVIDEAPTFLLQTRVVDLQSIQLLISISEILNPDQFNSERDALRKFAERAIEGADGGNTSNFPAELHDINIDFAGYFADLRTRNGTTTLLKCDVKSLNKTIDSLEFITKRWAYLSNDGDKLLICSSDLMFPKNLKKPVILDATAKLNSPWLKKENVEFIEPIAGIRSYKNMTLHVRRETGTGKSSPKPVQRLLEVNDLESGRQGKALIAAHKDHLKESHSQLKGNSSIKGANWFGIDGKNDWQDCERVYLLSLPHVSEYVTALNELAESPPTPGSFVVDHQIQMDTKAREMAALVVQAINRIRCRTVIDEDGNCAPCEGFICIPPGAFGDRILELIWDMMPGLKRVEWLPRRNRQWSLGRARYGPAVVEYLGRHHGQVVDARQMCDELGMSEWERSEVFRTLRNKNAQLTKFIVECLGIRVDIVGASRARRYLLRVPSELPPGALDLVA